MNRKNDIHYGITELEKATRGILVTTSHFTKSAQDFAQSVGTRLLLADYDTIVKWLKGNEKPLT